MLAINVLNGLCYGSLLFIVAAGFSIAFGVLRVLNMAHGSLFLLGAQIAVTVSTQYGFVAGIAGGALVAGLVGFFAERLVLRHMQGRYLPQLLATIGLYLALAEAMNMTWGGVPRLVFLPPGLTGSLSIFGSSFPTDRLLYLAVAPAIALLLWGLLDRTTFGGRVRASVDDEEIAAATGIRVPVVRSAIFVLGSALAGFAGGLGGSFIGAHPGVDMEMMMLALVIVVIGGSGSILGTYVAASLVGIIDSVGKALWPEASSFLLFAPMLVVLLVRPYGLFGRAPSGHAAPTPARTWTIVLPRTLAAGATFVARPFTATPTLALIAALVAFVALGLSVQTYLVGTMTLVAVWALFACGLNVTQGSLGLPSLGHALFFGLGAYVVAAASGAELAAPVALGAALLAGVICGALFHVLTMRTRNEATLLVTLAFAQVAWSMANKLRSVTNGDDGITFVSTYPEIPRLSFERGVFVATLAVAVVALAAYGFLLSGRVGMLLSAMRDNEGRLKAFGYTTWRFRLLAILVSGALSALAGGLYAEYAGFVSPGLFGVTTSARVLLMVTLGVAGTLWGPLFGASALIALEEVLSAWSAHADIFVGLVFIALSFAVAGCIRVTAATAPARAELLGRRAPTAGE